MLVENNTYFQVGPGLLWAGISPVDRPVKEVQADEP